MNSLLASAANAALAETPKVVISPALVNLLYLIASVMFIWGIKMLSSPKTAIRGNLLASLGMLIAIVVTLLDRSIVSFEIILAGIVVGSAVGAVLAIKVPMTGMPQMVGLLNGFGGGASLLVAGAALIEKMESLKTPAASALSAAASAAGSSAGSISASAAAAPPSAQFLIATALSGIIGAITFWGSLVAFCKLQGVVVPERPVIFKGQHIINLLLGIVAIGLSAWLVAKPDAIWIYWAIAAVCTILGVLVVIPIGGADMPVVICLLNSYSGLAGAATGFVLDNSMLIIAGSLVGASGIILTQIMCKAMNRSFMNVLLGGFGSEVQGGPKADDIYKTVKATDPEEIAMILSDARRVVVVPGYGMAVSQAQHAVRDLARLLEERGAEVEFAIHPVAGRMPGHMNVLLAEADVSYDKLKEMDEINPTFEQTDVVIVIGANDVVNPLARTDPKSPIAGMPILDVDKARTVIVIKRSLSPGFAGIPNPLFAASNTLMFFSDGKKAVLDIVSAVKAA